MIQVGPITYFQILPPSDLNRSPALCLESVVTIKRRHEAMYKSLFKLS